MKKKKKNKAGYTATPVACGWAGAKFEVSGAFGQERFSQKKNRNAEKVKYDGRTNRPTDRRTNGPTDRPTQQGVESRIRD